MSTMARKSGMRNRWGKGCTLVPQLDYSCNESRMDDVIGDAEWCWFGPFYGAYQVNFRDGFHIGAGQWLRKDWDVKPVDMVKRVAEIPAFQAMCRVLEAKPREYQAHLLPWMEKPVKSYRDGMMLVGDAAAFPCPLEGEGVWHACTSGKFAGEVAALACSSGDASEKTLQEYEVRWKASSLGLEHKFGKEFTELWDNSIFNPELMKKQIQFLLEFSMLHPFSIVFDWGDAHMECFNQHLEHFLDLAPEFADFAKTYVLPLGKGIHPELVERMMLQLKPNVPVLKHFSDKTYLKVLPRLAKMVMPAGLKQG